MNSAIAVIGTGYVGLTTGACLAHLGHDVTCADIDEDKVARLERGDVPIFERGLTSLVHDGLQRGNLRFVVGAALAAAQAEIHFLCLPTPSGPSGEADLGFLIEALAEITPVMPDGSIVVTKSTVPIGTADLLVSRIGRSDIAVVSNPEFPREGTAVDDFLHPDRIVLGSSHAWAAEAVQSLYAPLGAPVLLTDNTSAEMIKYASNSFLATKLSFVNAIAGLCDAVGADIEDVALGMGLDTRIGPRFLAPGPGWGGSCFPKDVRALAHTAREAAYQLPLLDEVIAENERHLDRIAERVLGAISPDLDEAHVAVLGLTFKAGTDDVRESPAIEVINRLLARQVRIRAYEPTVTSPEGLVARLPDLDIELAGDAYAAAEGASALVILTEWSEFAELDFDKVSELMAGSVIVDCRNLLDPVVLAGIGMTYHGVGRGRLQASWSQAG